MKLQIGDMVTWYERYEQGPSYGVVSEIVLMNKATTPMYRVIWFDEAFNSPMTYHEYYLKKV